MIFGNQNWKDQNCSSQPSKKNVQFLKATWEGGMRKRENASQPGVGKVRVTASLAGLVTKHLVAERSS